jgi:hypothetical protein
MADTPHNIAHNNTTLCKTSNNIHSHVMLPELLASPAAAGQQGLHMHHSWMQHKTAKIYMPSAAMHINM